MMFKVIPNFVIFIFKKKIFSWGTFFGTPCMFLRSETFQNADQDSLHNVATLSAHLLILPICFFPIHTFQASPTMELQSVGDTNSVASLSVRNRSSSLSITDVQLPPIKTNSAPSSHYKARMAATKQNNKATKQSIAWGKTPRSGDNTHRWHQSWERLGWRLPSKITRLQSKVLHGVKLQDRGIIHIGDAKCPDIDEEKDLCFQLDHCKARMAATKQNTGQMGKTPDGVLIYISDNTQLVCDV